MSLTSVATLTTISRKHAGFPFVSLTPFALDSLSRPIFLISNMIGNAEPVPENDVADAREKYLARHENSRYWVDFSISASSGSSQSTFTTLEALE
jgi:hypothetical protein